MHALLILAPTVTSSEVYHPSWLLLFNSADKLPLNGSAITKTTKDIKIPGTKSCEKNMLCELFIKT